jgi:aminopeptidase YwaD
MRRSIWLSLLAMVSPLVTAAQEQEDRALYTWQQMRQIVDETSGERAIHHATELAPFPHSRSREEYERRFRESDVIVKFAQEYGFSNVEVESFPGGPPLWQATQGELWLVEPEQRKLYDVHDVIISCVAGSEVGDITAEVVDVGSGSREEDYAGKDVKGKIVLGSAQARILQQFAVLAHGAIGVISYQSHRTDAFPSQVLDQERISGALPPGKKGGFAWGISPLVAHELIARIRGGEKVKLRSIIKAETFPGRIEVVHATIPGDGSTDQAIMVSAHIFEFYTKQGANDNASGTAMTLEMGRAMIRLISEGKLPKPKRTIHFTWVAEFSGTLVWLAKHDDIRKKVIADLNFDQVGLNLRGSSSVYLLYRTPDTVPSYLNDVCANFLEFVAKTNRERIRYRYSSSAYGFAMPITAPTGSGDPFYAGIEKHMNASDHRVYLDKGVAAVVFNDWPDMFYHSSHDTPYQGILDATQLKRAAVIGIAATSLLASADDPLAGKVLAESLARGSERLGDAQRKGLGYMADSDASSLQDAYKEARNTIRHQAEVEKAVLDSVAVLFSDPAAGTRSIAPFQPILTTRAEGLQSEATAYFKMRAAQYKIPATDPFMTDAEKTAAASVAEAVPGAIRDVVALEKLPPARRAVIDQALAKLPQHMTAEFNILMAAKKPILEIRNFLSGEFDPLPLADLMQYIDARVELGNVRIVKK